MKQPLKMVPAEFSTVSWHWTVPDGQTLKDVLAPSYWQHVTAQLRPGHEVTVVAEDRSYWARLLVLRVDKQEALMGVILSADFDGSVSAPEDEIETFVKWRSPACKFGVFRKSDGECLHDGFETKADAMAWGVERSKSMAA